MTTDSNGGRRLNTSSDIKYIASKLINMMNYFSFESYECIT